MGCYEGLHRYQKLQEIPNHSWRARGKAWNVLAQAKNHWQAAQQQPPDTAPVWSRSAQPRCWSDLKYSTAMNLHGCRFGAPVARRNCRNPASATPTRRPTWSWPETSRWRGMHQRLLLLPENGSPARLVPQLRALQSISGAGWSVGLGFARDVGTAATAHSWSWFDETSGQSLG